MPASSAKAPPQKSQKKREGRSSQRFIELIGKNQVGVGGVIKTKHPILIILTKFIGNKE